MTNVRAEVEINGTWTVCTDYVFLDGEGIESFRGYPRSSDEPTATEIRAMVDNTDGRWSRMNVAGAWWPYMQEGTQFRVSRWTGAAWSVRATGQLYDLPLDFTPGDDTTSHRWAHVTVRGRLAAEDAATSSGSFLRRNILAEVTAGNVVAYWPGEDPSGSSRIISAVRGQPDITNVPGVNFAADADYPGSDPLWTFTEGVTMGVGLAPYERPIPERWTFGFALRVPEEPAGTAPIIVVGTPGDVRNWLIELVPGSPPQLDFHAYNVSGTDQIGTGTVNFTVAGASAGEALYGEPVAVVIDAVQDGADIDWSITLWHNGSGQGRSGTITSQTLTPIGGIASQVTYGGMTFGHWAVGITEDRLDAVYWDGMRGLDPVTQFARVAIDADWPLDISAWSGHSSTTEMGPLGTDNAASRLRLITRTEHGLMFEARDGDIVSVPRSALQNQTTALELTLAQIASLKPIGDRTIFTNRVTARNEAGGEAVADAPAPFDPTTTGTVAPGSIDVCLDGDDALGDVASYEATLKTWPDYQYEITLLLHGPASGLLADVLALEIGDLVTVPDPPGHVTSAPIAQQVMGIREYNAELTYTVILNTRPAGPWQTFTAETGPGQQELLTSVGSRLLAAIGDDDTSAIVGTYGDPFARRVKWSTSGVPYDVDLRGPYGERATVTAVADNPPTYVAAGAAVHADNAAVQPDLPAGLTVGDCVYLVAAIRDTTDGEIDDIDGWTRLPAFGRRQNVALFARQYASGDAAPTVTPLVTAAGDTVSAFTFAFRYAQPVMHARAIAQSNASAADVAYPGYDIAGGGTVALIIAWKADDCSAMSTPAGFTAVAVASTTTGGDQTLAVWYQVQTSAANVAAGTITVTGGASAISRAGGIAVLGDGQTLTLTRGVGGVAVAHPAGGDVQIWAPGRASR